MGFMKAVPKREYMKAGLYGATGSGKTLTALMLAEGLAKLEGKRVAFIDTERGTTFYQRDVPERAVHPAGFDFDILETRSLYEALDEIEKLDLSTYGVLVIDSMTALWDAAKAAYKGPTLSNGAIPVQAWGPIKKPYKRIMSLFLDLPLHAIICGREGLVMEENAEGETKVIGKKMKAEGETQYEPHVLVQMLPERQQDGSHKIRAFFEKDRSGILTGKTFDWPTFETFAPAVRLLVGAGEFTKLGSAEENADRDAEAAERRRESEEAQRQAMFEQILTAIRDAADIASLKSAWELTKGKKTKLGEDLFTKLETAKDERKDALTEKVA